ncbi:hypothetical protein HH308_01955 [Gordonia sp. TBRC 11910]|uniref:Transcriptional regulator, AbiEi antitoxin, Type IV TA system n=1 Tax=Gordonia asplenii TaxID=2725283 RepID=A0A848KPV4_9ACTN|nr:hypothetical protein [Gordonia asplenii]NMN99976.1 hypothetical protein [Gordonia asplenii]
MSQSILDPQAFVFRGAALAYGMTDAQLKRAASKTRELARVAPGVYVRRPDRHLFPEEWHRLVALAVGSSVASAEAPTSVLSFQSAAAVHGLDLLAADFERVHFTNFAKLMREGQESSDVVIEEKIREDLLRSLGFEVVRWTWSAWSTVG